MICQGFAEPTLRNVSEPIKRDTANFDIWFSIARRTEKENERAQTIKHRLSVFFSQTTNIMTFKSQVKIISLRVALAIVGKPSAVVLIMTSQF